MSSDRLNVRVVSNQNSVELTKNENTVVISDKNRDTSVNVTQKETTVVTVVSKGPKGDKGDKGDTGNAGTAITNQITTGSITASVNIGTDTFNVQSGSSTFLFVSSSGNVGIGTTTPTNTLQVVGGITATSITSSLLGTASVAVTAQTASFLPIGTYSITSSWAQSTSNAVNAQTASFLSGAFLQNGNSFGATALLGTNDTQNLQFETNGSVRMTISSSGNVGIGTTTPFQKLYVDDDIGLKAANFLNLAGDQGSSRTAGFQASFASYDKIFVYTNNSIIGSLSRDNGWGIGFSTQPSSRLQVRGSGATSATTALRIENSNASASLVVLDDGTSAFNTNHLYVSSSGRVGIGTTTPIAQLHVTNSMLVNGTSDYFGGIGTTIPIQMFAGVANNGIGFRTDNFYLYPYGNNTNLIYGWNGNAAWTLRNLNTSSFQIFNNSPTNAVMLTVSSSGNVGIGTSVPNAKLHISSSGGYQLRVAASASFSSSLMVSGSFGYVGIGVESPQSLLHVNDRPEFNNVTGNVAAAFAGNYQNITTFYNNNNQDNTVLGDPAAWMSIKCDGTEYLIPLYTS